MSQTITFIEGIAASIRPASFSSPQVSKARASARDALEAMLSRRASVAGEAAQIRAFECLRAGPAVGEHGERRNLTRLDLIQMEAAPLQILPVSADGRAVGVIFGTLLFGERLFAVAAISGSLALEMFSGQWIAASADIATKPAPDTRTGMAHELAGAFLHRQTPRDVTTHLPLLMASPVVRAGFKVDQYDPEINAVLSVATDIHAYGESFVGAVAKTQRAFIQWRNP